MSKDPTCEERIDAELRDRLGSLREIFAKLDAEDDGAYEDLDSLPLSIETVRQVRIVLSTGGPHDEFLVTLDSDGSPSLIEYIFQDWFDGARRTLSDIAYEDHQAAERFAEYFTEAIDWQANEL